MEKIKEEHKDYNHDSSKQPSGRERSKYCVSRNNVNIFNGNLSLLIIKSTK